MIFVSTKGGTADAILKAKLLGGGWEARGGEKKNQNSVDIDDHSDVQFPVYFFFSRM